MRPLGSALPAFSLPDTAGRLHTERDFASSSGLLVAFICPHCPFVKHVRQAFGRFAAEYVARGIAVVGINSNAGYPGDDIDGMKAEIEAAGYTFPYLFDETQEAARAFEAACTPDFFLFDRERRLAYRGQFDGSRPSHSDAVTGSDLRAAADEVLAGRAPNVVQRPSSGCNIKWRG
jgi:peroxiredoxin